MIQLSFIEKIQALLEIVKSSSLFIILFLVAASLIALLAIDYKTNKKVNGKLFIATIVITLLFVAFWRECVKSAYKAQCATKRGEHVNTFIDDIKDLFSVNSEAVKKTLYGNTETIENNANMFDSLLNAAMNNINETNGYLSDQENEELKLAMGISENTHDLSIAIQKAETALQYTVAVRDKLLAAYNEIMQMQI